MKTILNTLIALTLISCGKAEDNAVPGACTDIFPRGNWAGSNHGHDFRVSFNADCTGSVSYPSTNSAKFTWAKPVTGYIPANVTETTGSAFLPQTTGNKDFAYAYQTNGAGSIELVVQFDPGPFNLILQRE